MHEASIALSILDIAEKHCRRAGYSTVESVVVDIGTASGVLPEALSMAFEIAKADTIAHEASLIINTIPIGGHCTGCSGDFTSDELFILVCPNCGDRSFRILTGRELDIKEIEAN
jgi:hydrogenase nickel incorporation protein HypA/HybF